MEEEKNTIEELNVEGVKEEDTSLDGIDSEEKVNAEETVEEEDIKEETVPEVKSKKKKNKKHLTKEQKKKKRIKGLIITMVVVLVLAIFFSVCAIVNTVGFSALTALGDNFEKVEYSGTQLIPLKDTDGYYTFTTDSDLKILQLTDVHIGGGCFSQTKDTWAMNAVATMIRQEQPDLVIVTGDIAYPVPFQAGTFNNLNATKIFANMMESLGVYWTFAFGNHDTEAYSMYSREDICKYYEASNYKYCIFQRGFSDDEKGYGNSIIKVKNSQGIVTQALVTLDSHSYIDGDIFGMLWKYDNLHQSQVDWYAEEIDKINASNKAISPDVADVKSLAFFHIPLTQYRDAWKEYKENNNQDTENVQYVYGVVGESDGTKNGVRTYGVFCGSHTDNFFEVASTKGLQGVFCGHDHYNNFSLVYKGIRLTYGMSVDYLAYTTIYKEHAQRGCTEIIVKSDSTFTCAQKNYYKDFGVEYEHAE